MILEFLADEIDPRVLFAERPTKLRRVEDVVSATFDWSWKVEGALACMRRAKHSQRLRRIRLRREGARKSEVTFIGRVEVASRKDGKLILQFRAITEERR